ncbi:DENN domain-containing protein 5B-like [Anneissia japonica]|uniref:DENN domain-containing protein 5B-like n=1 Tax=Anneissia japonica TaxID=1529436 RepID=UPI001425A507|nr:DENN domain-containing protein 5B-like [Anneissia japonica]
MGSPSGHQFSPGRFVDYFVVCGLDPTSGLHADHLSGDSNHVPPLQRGYTSQVLQHYPKNVDWNPFDDAGVNMLCMPKGLSFRTHRDKRAPHLHSFLMTREDGTRVHGAALTFYEPVEDQGICISMQALHTKYQNETRNRENEIKVYGGSPQISRRNSTQSYATFPKMASRRPSASAIGRISPKIVRRSDALLCQNKIGTYNFPKDRLYVTKCICLIMQMPYIKSCFKFLMQIEDLIASKEPPKILLESCLYNLLYEVPLPPPGRSMKFSAISESIFCQCPANNELPLFEYPLQELFNLLSIDNIVELYTCALLEHQILLVSKDYQRLMVVAESISCLLFPFSWQHVYVPILPASMLYFLDAPVPFIMGLHLDGSEDNSQLEMTNEASLCFVDIDNHSVEFPEDLPSIPNKGKLIEEIAETLHKYNVTPDLTPASIKNPEGSEDDLSRKFDCGLDTDHDSSYFSSCSESPVSMPSMPSRHEILSSNEIFNKVADIVKRTGVITDLHNIQQGTENVDVTSKDDESEHASKEDVDDMLFNNAIRESFLWVMVNLLLRYESFVIQPKPSTALETWFANREHMQNFDKAAFLSDQPEASLPFLSAFIETQMFATFIDSKIISSEVKDRSLCIFDERVEYSKQHGPTSPVDDTFPSPFIKEAEEMILHRAKNIDFIPAKSSHQIGNNDTQTEWRYKFFPILKSELLIEPTKSRHSKHRSSLQWRERDRQQQHLEHLSQSPDERRRLIKEATAKPRKATVNSFSHANAEQTNTKFVGELLTEVKTKTKRLLVFKMGQEAVELGHGEVNRSGVEENTLIASLCDLLERIFSHHSTKKQCKSALWSLLMSYKRLKDKKHKAEMALRKQSLATTIDTNTGPSRSVLMSSMEAINMGRRKSTGSNTEPVVLPPNTDLVYDMRKIQAMPAIKTDVGCARAWVRLALERKLLNKHMKEVLYNSELMKKRYKRCAFLRTDDEKEQFLFHLLSLEAVDFFCFTNAFPSAVVSYKVTIFQSRKFQAGTSANPWICLAGEMGETGMVRLPKYCQEILFEYTNLGRLSTLRIGHDGTGILSRWMVEQVLVRNQITGHTYKASCERLLVGQLIAPSKRLDDVIRVRTTSPMMTGSASPTSRRRSSSPPKPGRDSLQETLTDAVNNIVKHFYRPEKERGSLTLLLCGEMGLVYCLDEILQHGFKSARLFRNNFFVWDFLEKVCKYLQSVDEDDEGRESTQAERYSRASFCRTINNINDGAKYSGKDGKFQLFVCIGIREHLLHLWIPIMANTPVTDSMYEEFSFLLHEPSRVFLTDILKSLDEFNFMLEASLTKGYSV